MTPQETIIVFTTSPTGLGHIRVTNALINWLPPETPYHIIGIKDPAIEGVYRLMSQNWILRELMEFFQTNETAEKLQTNFFTWYEYKNIARTLLEINQIIKQNSDAKKMVIVSTHAQLARRIQKMIDSNLIPIPTFHTVIVTDDSPQRLWAACTSLVIVPSQKTLQKLSELFVCDKLHKGEIVVAPYPINPEFTKELNESGKRDRAEQLCAQCPESTRICVPISGAAVQLEYMQTLIDSLVKKNGKEIRFSFDIVTKKAPYTEDFIRNIKKYPEVTLLQGETNTQTVEMYDSLYNSPHPPSIEITKPSEQCFKVQANPKMKGGVIVLLTQPVGRQEYDNLDYLERNGFLPTKDQHTELWNQLEYNDPRLDITHFKRYRALMLPSNPKRAALLIKNCLEKSIFDAMYNYEQYEESYQLSPFGVEKIWHLIQERL